MATPLRVLILEDNLSDAELVLHALRLAGYDPIAARVETEEAYLAHLDPALDIILSDYNMPQFDGLRALQLLKEQGLDIPFIIVSGSIGEDVAVTAMRQGATDYLLKDRLSRLGPAVTQALERKRLREAKRQAEQALREGEELLRNAFDYANMAMVVTDLNHRFLRANDAFVDMFGHSQLETLGLAVSDIIHPDDLADSITRLKALLAGKSRYFQMEKRFVHKDGHVLWGLANMSLVHDARGKPLHYVGQVQDLTERKHLEDQFHQAQKMEAVGQLAGGVAHDFNNLLTIISGYSELLLSKLGSDDPMRGSIKAISEAGERAASLTRQLLAFSRKTVLEPKVLDLNQVVRETEKILRRLIGEDILITAVLDPTISSVKVDPGQLGQVLMNLAINARDAMPRGGKLTVETRNVELDQEFARLRPEVQPGRYVLLAITDTGSGMTAEVKARIFEPFFTTKGVGKGTGLGLAVVLGIVKQSNGHVEVDSEPDIGTTFKVYFPAVEEKVFAPKGIDAGTSGRGTETVLLVEDEDGVRALAVLVLQAYGYKVLAAGDGKKTMRLVEKHQGAIDLLLTDVVMPGMGGPDLAEALRLRFPQMKVLFSSGYTDDAVVRHGLLQEKVAFLPKPYTPLILVRKVRQVLDEKSLDTNDGSSYGYTSNADRLVGNPNRAIQKSS